MKKLTLLFIVLLCATKVVNAQNWAGGIDDGSYNWGYTFQYISAEYKIWKNPNWRDPYSDANDDPRSFNSISSKPTPGFAIGFVANGKITNNVDGRFTPTLVFSDRIMDYTYAGSDEIVSKKTQATMIDMPLSLKLKSNRLMNFRAYVLGGLKYSVDMASKKKQSNIDILDEQEKNLRNKRNFLSYEAGAGMDFYFPFFKMSTEVKVSHSFKDIIIHENTVFANPIEKAKLRHFTFSLFFE
ncbi:type IX secretion/gliding motility protein PorT/SprT [Pedobacter insulae]|uniref:Outer membrane protein beta-barrel domain-containing protein n=1 Tax=Pedobacter insulae TaxID=414048 RepID=A0A1I2XVF9_9SPHI|nr:outer membrane beta-barrel protein [Pedobacter insulae]SFH17352.1 Outer membrane protein beta-barrel domain-containing protein [Pedobacter insulae]